MSSLSRIPALTGVAGLAVMTGMVLGGCAGPTSAAEDGRLQVLASFYPLQYVAEQVGGPDVAVANLTPPGAEPHDLELSPAQVRRIGDSDVVVHLGEFQPAVDEAIAARAPAHVVDAADAARLEDHHAEDEHAEDEHGPAAPEEHGHGALDPHFWLDPTRLAAVAEEVGDTLAAADPEHAADYAARADALVASLEELDAQYADGLADCRHDDFVTTHESFGYLADRYGLHQVGISGLDPDAEPSPARLREVGELVREEGVTTIFFETLVSPKVAETLADDLGIRTEVLDPLEGQPADGSDYREVMLTNLASLRAALVCG